MGPLIAAETLAAGLGTARVIDARASRAAYDQGHVSGAVHADLERDLSTPADPTRGGRHPLPSVARWATTLGRWAITPSTRVYVYDDTGGAIAAARVWWMLRAAGHEAVAVVDGGWQALGEAQAPIDSKAVVLEPSPPYPMDGWVLPTVALEELRARLDSGRGRLIDVRAAERWRGESEPIDPVAGRIPGSVNLPLSGNLDASGRFLPPDALRARYEAALGGALPEDAVLQCGSGVTACHGLLAMEHAGLSGAALYVGSWSEWCRQPADP